MHPVGGLLRLAGGGEDRAWVGLEDRQPGSEVSCVLLTRPMRDAEIGHHETGRQLRHDLVHGVLGRAEASGEVAVQPVGCPDGMAAFVLGHAQIASFVSSR
jgi:hypothetical protein